MNDYVRDVADRLAHLGYVTLAPDVFWRVQPGVDLLDGLDTLTCPVMFHFGDADPYLPNEHVDAIRQAMAGRHNATIHVHAGGRHAFDNGFAPHFSQPEIAARAWMETSSFLYMHLGGPGSGT